MEQTYFCLLCRDREGIRPAEFADHEAMLAHAVEEHGLDARAAATSEGKLTESVDEATWYSNRWEFKLPRQSRPWCARVDTGDKSEKEGKKE